MRVKSANAAWQARHSRQLKRAVVAALASAENVSHRRNSILFVDAHCPICGQRLHPADCCRAEYRCADAHAFELVAS